jgi:hypothetical protein
MTSAVPPDSGERMLAINVHIHPPKPQKPAAYSTDIDIIKVSTILRLLLTTLLAAMLAIGLTGPGRVQAAGSHAPASTAPCAIHYINGSQICYAPAQLIQAERQAPIAIRPSAAVTRLLRLTLAQIINYQPYSGTRSRSSISYLYGALRSDYGRAPGNPRSMIITEYPTRYTTFVPRYTRIVGSARFEISQAALDHPYHPWGPWYVVGNFAHHIGSFTITANVPQGKLLELAGTLRRQG